MGQDFAKNCCNGDIFIQEEEEPTNLNIQRWRYLNNEQSELSGDIIVKQPAHIEKDHISSHKDGPSLDIAKRVESLNSLSSEAKKAMDELREFTLVKEREKLPVLGPYLYLKNKSTYYGQYKKGQKHGIGQCVWKDGSKYHGEWNLNKMSGKGRLVTSQGDLYEGDFLNGRRDGKGKLTLKDNETIYSGGWSCNLRDGTGIQLYPDGGKFVGTFKKGVRHGLGMYQNKARKFKMKGKWENGKRNGEFVVTVNGKKFTDNYQNGKMIETYSKNGVADLAINQIADFIYDDTKTKNAYSKINAKSTQVSDTN